MAPETEARLYQDLADWPRSWMGSEQDLGVGEQLVASFQYFIRHLASGGLSPKTMRRHIDNLWILGGEVIGGLYMSPSRRKLAVNTMLANVVSVEGGPLIAGGDAGQQISFDATCRKLHRYLTQQS